MKKLWIVFALALPSLWAGSQAVNPQNSFSTAVNVNSPSLWMNFNDATTSFKDSVSGLSFGSPSVSYGGVPTSATVGGNVGGTITIVNPAFPTSGTLQYIYFKANATPTATQTFLLLSGTGPSFTIVSSFTATVAATTSPQILIAGINFAAQTVTAGQYMGNWVATGVSSGYNNSGPGVYYLTGQSSLPSGPATYTALAGYDYSFAGGVVSTSLASAQQPGFDNTNNANFSVKFPYNSAAIAPNTSLGSGMEWNTPWSLLVHVDKMNWNHGGDIVLASKGDVGNSLGTWWKLYLTQNGTSYLSKLCFARNNNIVGYANANQAVCTNLYFDMVPNGFNYDIVVTDAGNGWQTGLTMYINGLIVPQTTTGANGNGWGGVSLALSGAGTGYAASTAFTSTGGGANCVVTGTMSASSGVPTSAFVGRDSGCTSTPTIVLTAPTGTGTIIVATSYAWTMNASTLPLMAPGYISGGTFYGQGGTDTTQNPLYVDEVAIMPGVLSKYAIANLFYQTKFYQNLLFAGLTANPPLVVFEGYGCGPDPSGDQSVAMTIGAAKAGLIHLIAMIDDDGGINGYNSVGWFRQMLDQAGYADVPVGIGPGSPTANLGGCPAATITQFNANTPQNPAAYPTAAAVLRPLYAKYSTTPIYFLMTQTATGYNNFQMSAADGVSPLTGLQLQAQNAANGGWVNAFNGNLGVDNAAYVAVLNNNGTTPVYFWGGGPAAGSGLLASRTSNDVMYMAVVNNSSLDSITGWTNLNVSHVLSPYFYGGVQVTYSGGTGYANATAFTSTGGGANCHVTGYMTASGGVPNGILTSWGQNVITFTSYWGLGYGCTSAPTLVLTGPTGTGVTLTAASTVTSGNYGGAGTNQFTIWPNQWTPDTTSVGHGNAPVFSWFENSLMDPPTTGAPRPY